VPRTRRPAAAQVDSERTRRLFLTYYSRLIHVFTSPKYCYFSGFAAPTGEACMGDSSCVPVLTSLLADGCMLRAQQAS
jgi:hypothetical protein